MDREFIKEEILKHALHYSNPNNISLSKEDGTELSLVEGLPSLAIFLDNCQNLILVENGK